MTSKKYLYRILFVNLLCIILGMILERYIPFEWRIIILATIGIILFMLWDENSYKISLDKLKKGRV